MVFDMKKPMTNDKCPIINDSGYALITMTFILVSFLSVVFMVSYPLLYEARDETRFYINDRNWYRWKKAWFGEMLDQSGAKLAHCGGYFSDRGDELDTGGPKAKRFYPRLHGRRLFQDVLTGKYIDPGDYKYWGVFWTAGYRGKQYVDRLPSDNWDYDTDLPYKDGLGKDFKGFFSGCGNQPKLYNPSARGGNIGFFPGLVKVVIELKDYSSGREDHKYDLKLALIGPCEDGARITATTFFDDHLIDNSNTNYVLHTFTQGQVELEDFHKRVGQKKLIVQVKQPAGIWSTMDTKILSFPPSISLRFIYGEYEDYHRKIPIYKVNYYG